MTPSKLFDSFFRINGVTDTFNFSLLPFRRRKSKATTQDLLPHRIPPIVHLVLCRGSSQSAPRTSRSQRYASFSRARIRRQSGARCCPLCGIRVSRVQARLRPQVLHLYVSFFSAPSIVIEELYYGL